MENFPSFELHETSILCQNANFCHQDLGISKKSSPIAPYKFLHLPVLSISLLLVRSLSCNFGAEAV